MPDEPKDEYNMPAFGLLKKWIPLLLAGAAITIIGGEAFARLFFTKHESSLPLIILGTVGLTAAILKAIFQGESDD